MESTLLTQKIQSLPADVLRLLSDPVFLKNLSDLENRYEVRLSGYTAQLLMGEIISESLVVMLQQEQDESAEEALEIVAELLVLLGSVQSWLDNHESMAYFSLPPSDSILNDPAVLKIREKWQASQLTSGAISDQLSRAILGRDKLTILAGFGALASLGQLRDILSQPAYKKMLSDFYQTERRSNDLQMLSLTLSDPRHLKNLIRIILEKQASCSPAESAHAAIDIVGLMNRTSSEKLEHWAYFDMTSNDYKWI